MRSSVIRLAGAEYVVREAQSEGEIVEGVASRPMRRQQSGATVGDGSPRPTFWRNISQQLKLQQKVFSDIARRKQWVLLVPLLLCGLLCGLGVFGVVLASMRFYSSQRAYAREAMASATASTIAGQLEIATFAVMSLSSYISQQPDCVRLNQTYNRLASGILAWDTQRVVYQLQALPAAVLEYIYPPVDEELGKILYGRDLLQVAQYRNDTLYQIGRRERLMLGPYKLLEGFRAIFVSYPIFLPAHGEAEDWGCRLQPYDCPPGLCWLPAVGEKLWGTVLGIISLDNMQESFRLRPIEEQGYRYMLRQLPDDVNRAVVISATDPPPKDPVVATISKFNLVWHFEVSPAAGWYPAWRTPCIVAVVVGSVVFSALVLWLLVTRERHNMLLRAMLPAKVIQQLQRGEQTVVEEFSEPVTILFSDIVSYTEVASQLTPLQVVRLLNDLYTEFDALTDKHGVYKVETIGDAFMCVSGCPIVEDPVKAAVRMAGMAQDMLNVVRKFVSRVDGNELQVQIRIGLHSGPVVAGVIGQRMPRYCLFGDTVNTASRMETNSAPMCINISYETAALLISGGATVVPYVGELHSPLRPSSRHISLTQITGGVAAAAAASARSCSFTANGIVELHTIGHPPPLPQAVSPAPSPPASAPALLASPASPLRTPLVTANGNSKAAAAATGGGGGSSTVNGWAGPGYVRPKVADDSSRGSALLLFSRGRINIKGKGPMVCFWLGAPPPPPPEVVEA